MSGRRHIPFSSVLMIGSLCLLAAFEFFWLRSEYARTHDLLIEQETQHLHAIIHELEDSLFHQVILMPVAPPGDSTGRTAPDIQFTTRTRISVKDTTRVVTILRGANSEIQDTFQLQHRRPHHGAMMLGMLVHQANADRDSAQVVAILGRMLSGKLNEDIQDSSEINNRLLVWTDSVPRDSMGFVSRPFVDVFSGAHYAIVNPRFQSYLLRQMVPQMLFALLLFGSISGAFWAVSQSLKRQRNLAMMRSNLISNISHELKTPISTVRVVLEALQEFDPKMDPAQRKEYLNIAHTEVNRLQMLVEKVLRSAGMENGKTTLKIELVDLAALTAQVLETLKMQFAKLTATVSLDKQGTDFSIEADRLLMTGLVHNLLDNALKYGGAHPEIQVFLEQQNGEVILTVSDHGQGIPHEYHQRIFDKFFRVPSGDIHNIKGHGLGLSYVAQIVKEHGGRVSLQSDTGQGATFRVTLPKHHAN